MYCRPTSEICLSPNDAAAPSANKSEGVRVARGRKKRRALPRVPPDKTYSACKPPGGQCRYGAHARVGNMHFIIIEKIIAATAAAAQHANFLHANGLQERLVPGVVWYISLVCPRSRAPCTANANVYDPPWPRAYFTRVTTGRVVVRRLSN